MAINIEEISWNRVFLEVRYRAQAGERLSLYRLKSERFVDFVEERVEDGDADGQLVHARVSLVESGNREPFDAGEWIFCRRLLEEEQTLEWCEENAPWIVTINRRRVWRHTPKDRRKQYSVLGYNFRDCPMDPEEIEYWIQRHPYDTHCVIFPPDILSHLSDYSRVFRYVGGKYVCAPSVLPRTDATDTLFVVLHVDFYIRNENPRVRRGSVRFIEKQIFATFHRFVHALFPHRGNRVLFLKENGEGPTENMAALRDRMFERGLDKDFVIKERYRNTFKKKQSVFSWVRDIVAIARADYIFIDDYCPVFNFVTPGDDVTLTQLWHAGVGFKSVGYARFGMKGSPDPYQSAHRRYDYALVGNEHLRQIYSEVFGIEQEAMLATGMPRLDHFLDKSRAEEARAELTEKYPWIGTGRMVVFAPTFRGTGQRTAHYPYDKYFDMQTLYDMCVETNTYFVFEMHHFIKKRPEIPEEFQDRIFDLSDESLTQLFYVADVLVTDYSSCFYDFILLQKPVIFYVPDKVIYEVTRGVQRTVDEMAPGVICESFDEFMEVLATNSYESSEPDPSMIDRCMEGTAFASDRAIDTILLGKEVPGVRMG